MVEYGVNVTNKFGFLSDDEVDDPEVMLRKAEALSKKDEKSSHQKKADKNAAAKKRKEIVAATAAVTAAREAEAKKQAQTQLPVKKNDFSRENKENRPEFERVRGRGRGRAGGVVGRGRGFAQQFDSTRPSFEQNGERDVMAERFGETRGRGRGRGGRGRPPFFGRGGRGGMRTVDVDQDQNIMDVQPDLNENNPNEIFGGERQNFTADFGTFRGSYRGGRGGFRGIDRENDRFAFRGGRGGRGGRQFDRMSGSDRTGIKTIDKKDGFGRGNWGTEQDDMNGQNEQLNESTEIAEKDELPPRDKTLDDSHVEADTEPEVKQLTLDEFKAQLAAKRSEPHFNIRQAGEGTNEKDFGKLVPLNKPNVEEPAEEEIVVVRREPRVKRLDIAINFTVDQRGGRGYRTRDGFRGGRGPRGGRELRTPKQMQPFEVSADAFPALGTN